MNIRTILLTGAGLLLLALGAIGVFLPVLPTTPFVLAGVGCLSGTPKLRAKVLQISFFREYFENYQNRNGLSTKIVIKSLVYLWGMLIGFEIVSGLAPDARVVDSGAGFLADGDRVKIVAGKAAQ